MNLIQHFIKSFIDWLFRRRSPGLLTMRIGLACLALAFGAGWALNVSFPFQGGQIDVGLDSAGGTPIRLIWAAAIIGLFMILAGLGWEIVCYTFEQRRNARKKIVIVEARGLRNTTGAPLVEFIPSRIQGRRDQVLVDLRQRVKDGEIVAPIAALEDLISLPADLKRREDGYDRRDLTLVYGGLMPVPFTFLTGVLIDDEGTAVVLD